MPWFHVSKVYAGNGRNQIEMQICRPCRCVTFRHVQVARMARGASGTRSKASHSAFGRKDSATAVDVACGSASRVAELQLPIQTARCFPLPVAPALCCRSFTGTDGQPCLPAVASGEVGSPQRRSVSTRYATSINTRGQTMTAA